MIRLISHAQLAIIMKIRSINCQIYQFENFARYYVWRLGTGWTEVLDKPSELKIEIWFVWTRTTSKQMKFTWCDQRGVFSARLTCPEGRPQGEQGHTWFQTRSQTLAVWDDYLSTIKGYILFQDIYTSILSILKNLTLLHSSIRISYIWL